MLALRVDFGWVFRTVADSVLSLIWHNLILTWHILSLNWHSLSLIWRALSQCGLVARVLCLHRYFLLKLVISAVIVWFSRYFSFLSDELSSGIWLEAASLSDSSLSDMVPGLIDLQLDAKAPSTVLKYKSGWLRWREWALSKIGVPVIPAKPLHIALFISELAIRSSENNIGVSSVEPAVYAIKWGHAMAGIEACPVSHPLVKFALEGAKRRLAWPVQPKKSVFDQVKSTLFRQIE